VGNHHRLAAIQIRSHHRHRDVQFLKLASLENALNQVAQPVIAGKAQPRNTPPGNIAQPQCPASRYDARQRRATSVSRAQDASTLVPAIQDIGMWCCSSTRSTPRCANPRAKPPPNASPSLAGPPVSPSRRGRVCGYSSRTEMPATPFRAYGRTSRKNSTYVLRSATPLKMRKLFRQYFLIALCSLCTIGPGRPKGDSLWRRDKPHGGGMPSAFATWIGQPVVLQVALGDIRVPLRGKLLKRVATP